jgi:transposase
MKLIRKNSKLSLIYVPYSGIIFSMKSLPETLPNETNALHKMVLDYQSTVDQLQEKLSWYEEQFRLLKHQRFGRSSEKCPDQMELFNEAESILDGLQGEPDLEETISYQRKKPGRKPLSQHIPREVIRYELPEAERLCDCGHALHEVGEDKSEQLEIIPAQIKVIEHVQVKYGCRACENGIISAPKPAQPIPRSFASASLLAYIIVAKFMDSLPLYRQETIFKRLSIDLSRATLSNWVLKSAELLQSFYDRLHELLILQKILQADETTLNVVQDGRETKSKSYMWLYQSGGHESEHPIVLYDYQATRAGAHAARFLQGFSGHLQVDGYAGYHALASDECILVGCMAHARRKFDEAMKALPKESRKNKMGMAQTALRKFTRLYALEKQFKDLTIEQRYLLRQEKSKPLLEDLKQWCDDNLTKTTKDSTIGKAIRYTINQWDKLSRYIDDGNIQIDNNAAERHIKPFVIGRKNWLFNQTPRGANASAILYSLVRTAVANNLEPFDYLKYLLTELPKLGRHYEKEALDKFLPWNLTEKIKPLR